MMHLYQKREAILRSTRQEIFRYGISAFRVEEIARLLGISKKTIYRIFPTRADLLKDCILSMEAEVKGKMIYGTNLSIPYPDFIPDDINDYRGIIVVRMAKKPQYPELIFTPLASSNFLTIGFIKSNFEITFLKLPYKSLNPASSPR